ncbi:unnamed protein product [Phaedon cochleariae]|uniref:Uncharacterized protein n=1 Tax=Phaedon cochleariae TaxID=80249 RepID=A0A9N9WZT0_PHACE|nr:unnamed protein product [Phaedon cochleariae]
MKLIMVGIFLVVVLGVAMGSPVPDKKVPTGGEAFKEVAPNPNSDVVKEGSLKQIDNDCHPADCNISCWQQGLIGGRCESNKCVCY